MATPNKRITAQIPRVLEEDLCPPPPKSILHLKSNSGLALEH